MVAMHEYQVLCAGLQAILYLCRNDFVRKSRSRMTGGSSVTSTFQTNCIHNFVFK